MNQQADIAEAQDFLYSVISKQADEKAVRWLKQQTEKLHGEAASRHLYMAFSTASRFFSKEPLQLSATSQTEAEQLRKGFQPAHWQVLQTARTYLLLHVPSENADQHLLILNKLFETADMLEQVALYAALPLLPNPEHLTARASEGLRTNITVVFDAIALHNPYPADYFKEEAWNQMVLKAVFMQRPLYQIYGAEARANEELARILVDFAHERWAAHRQVMPELWRFIAPFTQENYWKDIQKVIREGQPLEVEAALLACTQSNYPGVKEILNHYPDINRRIETGDLTWQDIGQRYANNML